MFGEHDAASSMVLCATHKIGDGHLKWKSGAIGCLDDV